MPANEQFKRIFCMIILMLEDELHKKGFEVSRPEVITEQYMTFLWSCLRATENKA